MKTKDQVSVEQWQRAVAALARNRYVVIDVAGSVVDTRVLQDGDTILFDAEADDV